VTLVTLQSVNGRLPEKEEYGFLAFGTPRRALSKREKKQKKAAPKSGPRLHEVEQPQRGEERPHGASSNIFFNHMCV
jgi:hypothetical protein